LLLVATGCFNRNSSEEKANMGPTNESNKELKGDQWMTITDVTMKSEVEAIDNDLSNHNVRYAHKNAWNAVIWTEAVGHALWEGLGIAVRIVPDDQRFNHLPDTTINLELRQIVGGNRVDKASFRPDFKEVTRMKRGWETKISDAFKTARTPGTASNGAGAFLLNVEILMGDVVTFKITDLPIEYMSKKDMMQGKEYWKRRGQKEKFDVIPELRKEYRK
jgi:hypothetical protein